LAGTYGRRDQILDLAEVDWRTILGWPSTRWQ